MNKDEISLRQGNVSLILESYNDLFSDFDPRPYSERALSDDFLNECRRAVRDRKEGELLQLDLMIQNTKRSANDENKIKTRLKKHFQKHFIEKQREMRKIIRRGIYWAILGAALILLSTFIAEHSGFIYKLMFVIAEPAGWFTIWTGLERIFSTTEDKRPEFEFYRKMAKLQIFFESY